MEVNKSKKASLEIKKEKLPGPIPTQNAAGMSKDELGTSMVQKGPPDFEGQARM